MNKNLKYGLGALLVVALMVVSFYAGKSSTPKKLGTLNSPTVIGGDFEVTGNSQVDGTFASIGVFTAPGVVNTGNSTISGTLSVTGSSTLSSLVQGGSVATISTTSATYTLTAANICNNSLLSLTSAGAVATYTFPASSTLASACLGVGQFKDIVISAGSTTSTVIAAGAGEGLKVTSSSTIAAGGFATLRAARNDVGQIALLLINYQ